MFTGIIQTKGKVASVTPTQAGMRVIIDHGCWDIARQSKHGDSICVNGVCLTVVENNDKTISFDVIGETLSKTTLGTLAIDSPVNLEASLTASTPMGGHFVQGHVDGVGTYTQVQLEGEDCRFRIKPPADLVEYIVPKGSVALDGTSMTIAAVGDNWFEVALIPTTIDMTTLGQAAVGAQVNIETDIISKTVVHWLSQQQQGSKSENVTMDLLRGAGFANSE
jgi:riboflavin synthase